MVKRKAKLTPEEQLRKKERREEIKYSGSIDRIFKQAGFISLKTEGNHFAVGPRIHELDHCFLYENIIIICEHTTGKKDSDHLRKKEESISFILDNKRDFISYLKNNYSDSFDFDSFEEDRYIIHYLYFSKQKIDITDDDRERYPHINFINDKTYTYFVAITSCIKKSARYEIFKYLNIKKADVGMTSTKSTSNTFEVTILYPTEVTGYKDVKIATFMVSPADIIENAYVLRKDNWEESMDMYQRTITKNRINDIRNFVYNKKGTFLNNIILSMPDNIDIKDANQTVVFDNLSPSPQKTYTMVVPTEFNSIGIIDGQHRVYAFYENDIEDEKEKKIKLLRQKLNLLATGIMYPRGWDSTKRRKFESDLFIEINKNPQKVKADLIMYIEMAKDPFNDSSIAREVLIKLNNQGPLSGKFQMSSLEKAPIKMTSIIKYALRNLVSTDTAQENLFKYYVPENGDKQLVVTNVEERNKYITYCSSIISQYFNAIKSNYSEAFADEKSMILKVISINGLLIALRSSLSLTNGPLNFETYNNVFSTNKIDFSKEGFGFAGSRYSQFGEYVVNRIFNPYFDNSENSKS